MALRGRQELDRLSLRRPIGNSDDRQWNAKLLFESEFVPDMVDDSFTIRSAGFMVL